MAAWRLDAAVRIEQCIDAVKCAARNQKASTGTYKAVKVSAEVCPRHPIKNAEQRVQQAAVVEEPGICQAQGLIFTS